MVPFSIQVARDSNYNNTIVEGNMWVKVLLHIVSHKAPLWTGKATWLCRRVQVLFFGQKCMDAVFFFPHVRHWRHFLLPHYCVWSCNVALWVEACDISLLFDEWQIYLAVRLWTPSDRLFHSHICRLASAVALRQFRAGAKPSPLSICNFHTNSEAEYQRTIPTLKVQCEWG